MEYPTAAHFRGSKTTLFLQMGALHFFVELRIPAWPNGITVSRSYLLPPIQYLKYSLILAGINKICCLKIASLCPNS